MKQVKVQIVVLRQKIDNIEGQISELWDNQLITLDEFLVAYEEQRFMDCFEHSEALTAMDDKMCRLITKKKLLGVQLSEALYKLGKMGIKP